MLSDSTRRDTQLHSSEPRVVGSNPSRRASRLNKPMICQCQPSDIDRIHFIVNEAARVMKEGNLL